MSSQWEMLDGQSRPHYIYLPKKGAPEPSLTRKEGSSTPGVGMLKLPQTTIFTIITEVMRHPLVARGVGDLGPAKAESPTLSCFPNLFRYFLIDYVTYYHIIQVLSGCILNFLFPHYIPQFSRHSGHW
jgi:hypothetical protein